MWSWRSLVEIVWMVPCIHAMILMGSIATLIGIGVGVGWRIYLVFGVALVGNLSLQFVDSNNCTWRLRLGVKGGSVVGGAPKMHSIFGGNRARHLHLGR